MQTAYIRDFEAQIRNNGSAVGGNERCRAEFAPQTIQVNGQPKTIDVCYITIPGDKTQRAGLRVTDEIKKRFPAEWLAYTNNDVMPVDGTPIETMPGVSGRFALEMKATGMSTIEDLANMTDGTAKGLMGGLGLRKKAQDYLANRKPDETNELRNEIAELKALVMTLAAGKVPQSASETQVEEKRGPGRPRKE